MPTRCDVRDQHNPNVANDINISQDATKVILPLKAVALLPSLIKTRLETERPLGLFALSFGLGAEGSCPLQLGSHNFRVTAEVAGTCTVWCLVPEKLGDCSVATADGMKHSLLISCAA